MHLPIRPVAPGDGPAISTSLTAAETAVLQSLAWYSDALVVGAGLGYAEVAMALAGAEHITSVDTFDAAGQLVGMRANLDAYKVTDRVVILCGPSGVVLPQIYLTRQRFDVILLDGDRTAEGVAIDVEMARRLLKPGGTMACHDYTEDCCCPGVAEALDSIFPGPPDQLVDSLYVVKP